MMFLRTGEMKYYADREDAVSGMTTDKQIHVNHEDCPAGTDTKARLYIKRAPDGVMFYCHHCGSKGYYRLKDRLYRASELIRTEEIAKTSHYGMLLDELSENAYVRPMSEWSPAARLWWASYGFTEDDAKYFGVQFYAERLWLYAGNKLFQGRSFGGSPKYYTLGDKNRVCYFRDSNEPTWVIVEDLLSMYKVYKAGGNAVCLLGTSMSDVVKSFVVANSMKVVLWLDDDTAGWNSATSIYTQLHGLIPDVRTIKDRQPKEHGLDFIKGIIHA
jgi:hypothetical protein